MLQMQLPSFLNLPPLLQNNTLPDTQLFLKLHTHGQSYTSQVSYDFWSYWDYLHEERWAGGWDTHWKIQAQISNCISGERITDLTLVKPKKCVATIGQSESINNNYTFKQHFKVPLFFPITIKLFLIALCPRCVWMLTQRLSKSADWHHIDKDKGADQDT